MNNLIYACPWQEIKEKSWSGTHNALYEALKNDFDVIDIDTELNHSHSIEMTLFKAWHNLKLKFHFEKRDMEISRMKNVAPKVVKDIQSYSGVILQFEECPPIIEGRKQYIYQDLSVPFIYRLKKENSELFEICGFGNNSITALQKRSEQQLRFYQEVTGIFTMSHWLKDELSKNFNIPSEKIYHVGGGYNVNQSKINYMEKKGNKILFIGRDFMRKNGPLVIEAFKLAREQRSDLELYIAGPKKIGESNGSGVIFLGDVPNEKLSEYFNLCDIFCMPSKFEAYGLVFPEALTYGLPCIGRNAYEMPYFIENGETGYLLERENAEELADKMLNLLKNENIKRRVRSRKEFYLREYSWSTVANRIYKIITG